MQRQRNQYKYILKFNDNGQIFWFNECNFECINYDHIRNECIPHDSLILLKRKSTFRLEWLGLSVCLSIHK